IKIIVISIGRVRRIKVTPKISPKNIMKKDLCEPEIQEIFKNNPKMIIYIEKQPFSFPELLLNDKKVINQAIKDGCKMYHFNENNCIPAKNINQACKFIALRIWDAWPIDKETVIQKANVFPV
ncbi:hypothetical protein, partial [Oenococcus oeni]